MRALPTMLSMFDALVKNSGIRVISRPPLRLA